MRPLHLKTMRHVKAIMMKSMRIPALFVLGLLAAQPLQALDLSRDKAVYAVGYAHLDTQ